MPTGFTGRGQRVQDWSDTLSSSFMQKFMLTFKIYITFQGLLKDCSSFSWLCFPPRSKIPQIITDVAYSKEQTLSNSSANTPLCSKVVFTQEWLRIDPKAEKKREILMLAWQDNRIYNRIYNQNILTFPCSKYTGNSVLFCFYVKSSLINADKSSLLSAFRPCVCF